MKTTAIPIENINRSELRKRIPHGGITKIVEKTGYSRNWITEVLSGNKTNLNILQTAYDLFWNNSNSLLINPDHTDDLVEEAA